MAFTTEDTITADGTNVNFSFTFPYIEETDIKVTVEAAAAGSDPVTKTNPEHWELSNATTVTFKEAEKPAANSTVRIFRDTNLDDPVVTYFAGSAIRAEDLNENQRQVLFSAQEVEKNAILLTGGTMTGDLQFNDAEIVFEGSNTTDGITTTLTVENPTIRDQTYRLPDIPSGGSGTFDLVTTGDTKTVTRVMLADDAINAGKLADESVDSEHYVDGSIDREHLAADIVDGTKIDDNAIDSEHYVDGSIDKEHLSGDCVDGTKIEDAAVDSEHIANGAIDNVHMSANSVDSDQYVDLSIDTAHIGNDQVTFDKLQNIGASTLIGNNTESTAGATALSTSDVRTLINVADGANNYQHPNHTGDVTSENDGATTIGDNKVTSAKILNHATDDSKRAVTTNHIKDNAITDAKLADHGSDDANRAVGTDHIKTGAVTSAKIADTTIVNGDIATNAAIAGSKINMSLNQLSDVNVGTPGENQDDQVVTWQWDTNTESGSFGLAAGGSGGSGLSDVVSDNTPQLGGDLDVNGNSIITDADNENVVINPHGSGAVNVSSSKIINVTDPTNDQDAATKKYVDDNTPATPNITAVLNAGNQSTTDMAFVNSGNATIEFNASSGLAVFNQNANTAGDFRVESNSNTHMLFIDASANAVGINEETPTEPLDVRGNVRIQDGNNLILQNGDEDHTISINADDVTDSYNLTLPPAHGTANQVLRINSVDENDNVELEWGTIDVSSSDTAGRLENKLTSDGNITIGGANTDNSGTEARNAALVGPFTMRVVSGTAHVLRINNGSTLKIL